MTRNRDPRRRYACAFVEQLLTAIAEGDRWAIARRTTGALLEQLLVAESSDGPHPLPRLRHTHHGLSVNPLAVVEDDVAVIIGTADGRGEADAIPLLAILVASETAPHPWLAAVLDTTVEVDKDSRIATVLGEHTEAADAQIIARHSPLDPTVTEVDWNNPAAVLRRHAHGTVTVTVADAAAGIPGDRSIWPYAADTLATLSDRYLRANYPELVREHRRPRQNTDSRT